MVEAAAKVRGRKAAFQWMDRRMEQERPDLTLPVAFGHSDAPAVLAECRAHFVEKLGLTSWLESDIGSVVGTHAGDVDKRQQQPLVAVFPPEPEPVQVGAGLAEELQLQLLELTGAEDEVCLLYTSPGFCTMGRRSIPLASAGTSVSATSRLASSE